MFIKLESSKAMFIKVGGDPFVGLKINLLGPSLLKVLSFYRNGPEMVMFCWCFSVTDLCVLHMC